MTAMHSRTILHRTRTWACCQEIYWWEPVRLLLWVSKWWAILWEATRDISWVTGHSFVTPSVEHNEVWNAVLPSIISPGQTTRGMFLDLALRFKSRAQDSPDGAVGLVAQDISGNHPGFWRRVDQGYTTPENQFSTALTCCESNTRWAFHLHTQVIIARCDVYRQEGKPWSLTKCFQLDSSAY